MDEKRALKDAENYPTKTTSVSIMEKHNIIMGTRDKSAERYRRVLSNNKQNKSTLETH